MSILKKIAFAGLAVAALAAALPASADDLAKVRERGTFSFAMSGSFPPFSFVNDKNEVVGFDVDIGNELAKRLGVKPVVVTTAWDGIIAGLISGKYDAVVGSMTITPEREKAVTFAGPYYHSGRAVFVPETSPAKSLDDLKDKSVGVTLGEVSDKWARQRGGWTVRTYKALSEALLDLQAGRIDAIAADSIPVLVASKSSGQNVREIAIPDAGNGDSIGIALRKNSGELKDAIQKALDDMRADGTYEKISMKWVGRDIR